MKRCSCCTEFKPLGAFQKNRSTKDGYQSRCRECRSGEPRKRTQADLEYLAEWRRNNPEKRKNQYLKYNFGMSIDDWYALYDKQGGKCAICSEAYPREPLKQGLHVDHCHGTGKIRGLLCGQCNKALGLFRENSATIASAITYLEEHQ